MFSRSRLTGQHLPQWADHWSVLPTVTRKQLKKSLAVTPLNNSNHDMQTTACIRCQSYKKHSLWDHMLRNTLKHKLRERFNNWPIVLQNREVTKVSENTEQKGNRKRAHSVQLLCSTGTWYQWIQKKKKHGKQLRAFFFLHNC